MNRRDFLKYLTTLPLVGLIAPRVLAEQAKEKRFVGDTGRMPPRFKWIMDGTLIEWPTKTHCEKLGLEVPECLIPGLVHFRIDNFDPEWNVAKHMPVSIVRGGNYSFGDGIFTRHSNSHLTPEEVASFNLQPKPIPPLGTKCRILLARYISRSGYYCYGYYAEII